MQNSLLKSSAAFKFSFADSNEVDFDKFRFFYYPHLPSEVTNRVDSAMLYTEIRSVIKGSLDALNSINGKLTEMQYMSLDQSRNAEFDITCRKLIYRAFEKYEQMKRVRGEYDMEDFVFHLHSLSNQDSLQGKPCTSVFIDEVQDLSASQISLFRHCCPNLAGFVMAGDTAQTISEGVAFRFEALKDIFFHQYLKGLPESQAKALTPNVWELTQNFRTHNSILFIARIIIDLIVFFFPSSIDRMKPETSMVFGPKPIFLESQADGDNFVAQLFDCDTTMVDFGAEQVILVRDEVTKEQVQKMSGQNALVLTTLEAKGMEFDDVMIINFFSSSPFRADWRVLENFENQSCELTSRRRFDPMRHTMMNTELKMLYVLVTRAKKRLIIVDDDVMARKPFLNLLLSKDLVEMKLLDADIKALFSGKSSASEWIQKGETFMSKRQFANAKFCFSKGGDAKKENHANAAQLEQDGDRIQATDFKGAVSLYSQSSELYLEINMQLDAARCLEKAKNFIRAASIYESIARFNNAGACYENANKLEDAAEMYWKADNILNALRCSYKCNIYRTALDNLLRLNKSTIIPNFDAVLSGCTRKGALYYHQKKSIDDIMYFVSHFATTDAKREFLKQYVQYYSVCYLESLLIILVGIRTLIKFWRLS